MTGNPLNVVIADCDPSPWARPIKPIHVEALIRSITSTGLLQPIRVRAVGCRWEIIAGGHRCEAFKAMGKDTIPALVVESDDLHTELALIDENLVRSELSEAERSIAIARRKAIYQALYPQTAHGGDRKSTRRNGDLKTAKTPRFTQATAKATGSSERTVQREAQRGDRIGEDILKKVIGTSLDKGDELDALAKLKEAAPDRAATLVERAAAGEKVSAVTAAKQENRAERERVLGAKQQDLPQKKFGFIYCDLARRFNVRSRETGLDRSPDNHYPTMTFAEACALDVPGIAAPDCIMAYWSTPASLIDDLEILAEWGFVTLRPREGGLLRRDVLDGGAWQVGNLPRGQQPYRSMQVWNKESMGLGYWFRGNEYEFVLVCARGNVVAPALGTQPPASFRAPRGEHSEKPHDVYEWIERLWPHTPKVELFARADDARDNWDTWGLEAPSQKARSKALVLKPIIACCNHKIPVTDHSRPQAGGEVESSATPNLDAAKSLHDQLEIPPFLRRQATAQAEAG